jgi:prevent-host-death family protein
MKTVGVRELKNRLSEYLRQVRAGEGLLVTDRGEVIAEITPPGEHVGDPSISPGLLALAKRKLVTLGRENESRAYPALRRALRKKRAGQLLDEERSER